MIYISETIAGIFAINENNQIIGQVLFDKDPQIIAENLYQIQKGIVIKEYISLLEKINPKKEETIVLEDFNLALKIKDHDYKAISQIPSQGGRYLRNNLIDILIKQSYIKNIVEFQILTQDCNTILTKKKISEASEKKDKLICQAIGILDYIDKTVNIFSEKIREWYSLHFPELTKLISNHNTFSKIVSEVGRRENFSKESFENLNIPEDKVEQLISVSKKSMGANIKDFDLIPIQEFGEIIKNLYKYRDSLEKYITDGMNEIAPNMTSLIGPLLAARLMNQVGGLEELSKKPASTIQVVGAEQALFRSIRTGSKPPKHGIIFQWDQIHGSPWWLRGKIARALAGKLSIASRLDAYSGEDQGDKLVAELETRIKDIKAKYPEPKKKPKQPEKKKDKKKRRKRFKKDKNKRGGSE